MTTRKNVTPRNKHDTTLPDAMWAGENKRKGDATYEGGSTLTRKNVKTKGRKMFELNPPSYRPVQRKHPSDQKRDIPVIKRGLLSITQRLSTPMKYKVGETWGYRRQDTEGRHKKKLEQREYTPSFAVVLNKGNKINATHTKRIGLHV